MTSWACSTRSESRCVLAGESQGGAIVQYAAVRHPERVEGLVLSGPVETGRHEANAAFVELCRSDYRAAVRGFVERSVPEPACEHVRRWGRNILLRADPEQAARILGVGDDDAVPGLDARDITAPTLILHGAEDDDALARSVKPPTEQADPRRRTGRAPGRRARANDDAAGRRRRCDSAPLRLTTGLA